MQNETIVIIGAGATGLMAARQLAMAGAKVLVLEARNRCGGRIHTLHNELFFEHVELGAEFIHGDLPVTLKLLKEAGIGVLSANAEMWHYKNGKFSNEDAFTEGWDLLMQRFSELEQDITISDFLHREFPEKKYDRLRKSVIRFVSGYDTGDPDRTSTFALREEWQNEDDLGQHRVKGGYAAMIAWLEEQVKALGGTIWLNTVVKTIEWKPGEVRVTTAEGDVYNGAKIILALPLGVLQADEAQVGAVSFYPAIAEQNLAIKNMGFGAIVKILLKFDEPFWKNIRDIKSKNIGFILSDEKIPTWWTQAPQYSTVLTGWLGGPSAARKEHATTNEILDESLQSLSRIFSLNAEELKDKLVAFEIMNWTADPFTRGSYAYDTVEAAAARAVLDKPVANTLFFAGEYLYEGPSMGTVEAALTSGEEVARKIIQCLG